VLHCFVPNILKVAPNGSALKGTIVAVCCSVLQCVVVCCPFEKTPLKILYTVHSKFTIFALCSSVLQDLAVSCILLSPQQAL